MKDLSLNFLKSLMGAKMGRGFKNFCNNDDSTSTLNQHNNLHQQEPPSSSSQLASCSSCMETDVNIPTAPPRKSVTLEEMIMQLELEEEKARRQKAASHRSNQNEEEDMRSKFHHRMSCVDNSDILRSARSALNQYPRFSLDGRDAMYRSSFHTNVGRPMDGLKLGRILHLPKSLGGESVIWCKPGVVPKLMGLDAMPLPISKLNYNEMHKRREKENLFTSSKTHSLRRQAQRSDIKRRQQIMDSSIWCGNVRRPGRSGGGSSSSSTPTGYCVMNPIAVEPVMGLGGPVSWPSPYNH